MADAAAGPVVSRPFQFATEDQRAVHSWSRISSAGQSVLLEALKILTPVSRDPSSTEPLVTFLQELSQEGHKPTVLRSKDVYGYRSSTNRPLSQGRLRPPDRNARPPAKRRTRRPLSRKREVHPSWSTLDRARPRIQGVRPPELLVCHGRIICRRKESGATDKMQVPHVQPLLRLTNIDGPPGSHTARLQIHTMWDPFSDPQYAVSSHQSHPLHLSGIPLHPTQNGDGAVALYSQKSLSCPARQDYTLIGDSAPVLGTNGRVFSQTHTELSGNPWRGHAPSAAQRGPGRGWKEQSGFRWKVVKVDDSRSVAEARRKAQKVLQVNLSPVIQIQPLHHLLRDLPHN